MRSRLLKSAAHDSQAFARWSRPRPLYISSGRLQTQFSPCPPGGPSMKVVLREDESGISEVIGTILILAMTVVLFSTIIIWVSNIPTPVAQGRLDVASEMDPMYNGSGSQIC